MRIWVTGTGLVTSLGNTREETWRRFVLNERAIEPIQLFDPDGVRGAMVGDVKGVAIPAGSSRTSEFARVAAEEALAEAGFGGGFPEGLRVGLVVGTTTGGMFEGELRLADMRKNGIPDRSSDPAIHHLRCHPLSHAVDRIVGDNAAYVRTRTVCSACSSGANALVVGANWLLSSDEIDLVVCGGAEGLSRLTFNGFNALGAVDPERSRPFDRSRKGLNLGEGAGFVVLERDGAARKRGARPISELSGWAIGAEAHHVTNPEPSGKSAARVISAALRRAQMSPDQIDYVNAHGTGTLLNDAMETAALREVFGDSVSRVHVSSSKGHIGHTLGASGAVEAVLSSLMIDRSTLLPTAGLVDVDPACELRHVRASIRQPVNAVLSNSFGFGGMDSALIFTKPGLGSEHAPLRRRVVVAGAALFAPRGIDDGKWDASAEFSGVGTDRIDTSLSEHLNLEKARRFDRGTRLGVIASQRSIDEAAAPIEETALVYSSAFGNVEGSVSFVVRCVDKGARFANPIDFPNLVPSAPVGHASVYLGARGPVLSTADLATSGESAFLQAFELIAAGEVNWAVAGGLEERSEIVERIFGPLSMREGEEIRTRAEGAFSLVLAESEVAHSRNTNVLAAIDSISFTTHESSPRVPSPSVPSNRRCVVITGAADSLIPSAWSDSTIVRSDAVFGAHEARGGMALAVACRMIAQKRFDSILVLGAAPKRTYAAVLSCA